MSHSASLELRYATRFKIITGVSVLIFVAVWIAYATDIYSYLWLMPFLLALALLLYIIGLFSSQPVLKLDNTGVQDFRRNRAQQDYAWDRFSKVFVKRYTESGYYFVLQGRQGGKTVRFPVGLWNTSGTEIAQHIEKLVSQSDTTIELNFDELYNSGFSSP